MTEVTEELKESVTELVQKHDELKESMANFVKKQDELTRNGAKLLNIIYRTNDVKRSNKKMVLVNKKRVLVNMNKSGNKRQKYYTEGYGVLKRLTNMEEKLD